MTGFPAGRNAEKYEVPSIIKDFHGENLARSDETLRSEDAILVLAPHTLAIPNPAFNPKEPMGAEGGPNNPYFFESEHSREVSVNIDQLEYCQTLVTEKDDNGNIVYEFNGKTLSLVGDQLIDDTGDIKYEITLTEDDKEILKNVSTGKDEYTVARQQSGIGEEEKHVPFFKDLAARPEDETVEVLGPKLKEPRLTVAELLDQDGITKEQILSLGQHFAIDRIRGDLSDDTEANLEVVAREVVDRTSHILADLYVLVAQGKLNFPNLYKDARKKTLKSTAAAINAMVRNHLKTTDLANQQNQKYDLGGAPQKSFAQTTRQELATFARDERTVAYINKIVDKAFKVDDDTKKLAQRSFNKKLSPKKEGDEEEADVLKGDTYKKALARWQVAGLGSTITSKLLETTTGIGIRALGFNLGVLAWPIGNAIYTVVKAVQVGHLHMTKKKVIEARERMAIPLTIRQQIEESKGMALDSSVDSRRKNHQAYLRDFDGAQAIDNAKAQEKVRQKAEEEASDASNNLWVKTAIGAFATVVAFGVSTVEVGGFNIDVDIGADDSDNTEQVEGAEDPEDTSQDMSATAPAVTEILTCTNPPYTTQQECVDIVDQDPNYTSAATANGTIFYTEPTATGQ